MFVLLWCDLCYTDGFYVDRLLFGWILLLWMGLGLVLVGDQVFFRFYFVKGIGSTVLVKGELEQGMNLWNFWLFFRNYGFLFEWIEVAGGW